MATNTSTGFASAILGPQAFDEIFRDGVIEVRTGAQPSSADAAPTGVLVGRITADGEPFTPGSPTNGLRFQRGGRFATKDIAQPWKLKGSAAGVAGWFRLLTNAADPGVESLVAIRIDGNVGVIDALGDIQVYLPTVSVTASTVIEITQWWYALPPIGE